jgi:pyridoxal phosphate enzyme (YggS family)
MNESGPGVAEIRKRLSELEARIEENLPARTHGPHVTSPKVNVLGVTKSFTAELILDAYTAGIGRIGENYAQELLSKAEVIRSIGDVEVHFIGQLQSNKVRSLVGLVDRFDSVDRASLVVELARRAPGARVLIQVDTSDEPGKGGCAPDEVDALCDLAGSSGLVVEGLMTVGPTQGDPEAARRGFALVRSLADQLGLRECSMGMSDDLEVAISEGATEIRVGRALFGPRT